MKLTGLCYGRNAHAAAPDRGGHRCNGPFLPDKGALQTLLEVRQALEFLLLDAAGGDLRPQLNDPGKIFHRERRHGHCIELASRKQAQLLGAQVWPGARTPSRPRPPA